MHEGNQKQRTVQPGARTPESRFRLMGGWEGGGGRPGVGGAGKRRERGFGCLM